MVPGTDHASIATEVKIVDQWVGGRSTETSGATLFTKGRKWKGSTEGGLFSSFESGAASCDWQRSALTWDEVAARL